MTISDASATVPATTAEPYSRKGFYLGSCVDHFRKLPAAQRLTGQDAIDYLTRCMRLL